METITIIIDRDDTATGNRYSAAKMFTGEELFQWVPPVGEMLEHIIVGLRKQLDDKSNRHKINATRAYKKL